MAAASNAARELAKRALSLYTANGHGARRRGVTEAVESFQRKPSDTGSPEVQVALITSRITHLTEHLKKNRKDHASARAVVALVHKRRTQMQYLLRKKPGMLPMGFGAAIAIARTCRADSDCALCRNLRATICDQEVNATFGWHGHGLGSSIVGVVCGRWLCADVVCGCDEGMLVIRQVSVKILWDKKYSSRGPRNIGMGYDRVSLCNECARRGFSYDKSIICSTVYSFGTGKPISKYRTGQADFDKAWNIESQAFDLRRTGRALVHRRGHRACR
eukprot:IDg14388t1